MYRKEAIAMAEVCRHLKDCSFVLTYVRRAKPHWDDFVTLYCNGDFQDVCKRLEWFRTGRGTPPPELMPTGHQVPPDLFR